MKTDQNTLENDHPVQNQYGKEITDEERQTLWNILLEKDWPEEARQIPLSDCTPHEQQLLVKCIDHQHMEKEEIEELELILHRYRQAIRKLEPEKQIQNFDANVEFVNNRNEFLKQAENYDNIITIPFTYPMGGKYISTHFDVYPITDSQAILDIQNNLSLFEDLTEKEKITYSKSQNNETLTHEELAIQAEVERKIKETTDRNQKKIIVEFLAMQLKFHDQDDTYEEMKEIFNVIPFVYLALLFQKVQEKTHLGDFDVDKVFQEFGD